MSTFSTTQNQLDKLLAMPANLPIVYLLGDTGAGKTCLVRQLLGTTDLRFPSARKLRTTVAPTEFIITNENELRAAFVFKAEEEVSRSVVEILEEALKTAALSALNGEEGADLTDLLGDSPDERFRLRCFLNERARERLGNRIAIDFAPRIRAWVEAAYPAKEDRSTAVVLAVEDGPFKADVELLRDEILKHIGDRIASVCQQELPSLLPATFCFEASNKAEFVQRLKEFLGIEEGLISPVIEKARVRGPLKSRLIPESAELVVIDGEGIGHDAREARGLSARHFDYFGTSDAIILVENSEKPFTGGGKTALADITSSGYLPNFYLAFTRLDLVESEHEDRKHRKKEADKGLRNALNALKDDGIHIEVPQLDVRYFSDMDEPLPDDATCAEVTALVEAILSKHTQAKARFVAPVYDFELLAAFLQDATTTLRNAWKSYIDPQTSAWQTLRAFAYRMSWKDDAYRWLQPVAEFRSALTSSLGPFISKPVRWLEEITDAHKMECIERLKQEISQQLQRCIRDDLLEHNQPNWMAAAELRGSGTTPRMRKMILDIVFSAAPELTGEHAKVFKDAIKGVIESSIAAARGIRTS